jgi:hypothetical protein
MPNPYSLRRAHNTCSIGSPRDSSQPEFYSDLTNYVLQCTVLRLGCPHKSCVGFIGNSCHFKN